MRLIEHPNPPRMPMPLPALYVSLKEGNMGMIFADLTLTNADDMGMVRHGYKKAEEVHTLQVTALVDTGAFTLGLPEHLVAQLDLSFIEKREFELADGSKQTMPVVGPVHIRFKNRQTICNAVQTRDSDVLLGAIPMEDMDVVLNPRAQTIEVNPESPYMPKMKLKGFSV